MPSPVCETLQYVSVFAIMTCIHVWWIFDMYIYIYMYIYTYDILWSIMTELMIHPDLPDLLCLWPAAQAESEWLRPNWLGCFCWHIFLVIFGHFWKLIFRQAGQRSKKGVCIQAWRCGGHEKKLQSGCCFMATSTSEYMMGNAEVMAPAVRYMFFDKFWSIKSKLLRQLINLLWYK